MSVDLSTSAGAHFKCNNAMWRTIVSTAYANGWEPLGTILYKPINAPTQASPQDDFTIHVTIYETYEPPSPDEVAKAFQQATQSGELDPDWDGSYYLNNGQIITAPDSANFAAALENALLAGDLAKFRTERIQELISLLRSGEVMIT